MSGVPWMDAMLRSVREEGKLYSHNQCVQYMRTHSHGHNIDIKEQEFFPDYGHIVAGILLKQLDI